MGVSMIIGWAHDIGWVTGLISFSKSECHQLKVP
jgi:hypothetical protein